MMRLALHRLVRKNGSCEHPRRGGVAKSCAWKILWLLLLVAPRAEAYTANKVWMEFRPNGIYRIYVNYTVPELKEFREAYVEFRKKKEAERFYFDLLRGADFYPPDPKSRRFIQTRLSPDPW